MLFEKLTPEEDAIMQWHYGYYGTFYKALFEAICRADDMNIDLLALGFPVEVSAYKRYKTESGWWKATQDKAIELGYLKKGCY